MQAKANCTLGTLYTQEQEQAEGLHDPISQAKTRTDL